MFRVAKLSNIGMNHQNVMNFYSKVKITGCIIPKFLRKSTHLDKYPWMFIIMIVFTWREV
jgi:hypothetical protein